MSKLLSILIPAYNCEDTLQRCLDSIITQPAFSDEIDILVLNDGSKDKTEQVILQYQNRCPQIRLISRPNKGIGPTRNELIDNTIADYFWFIDADDYINDNVLEEILDTLNHYRPDMIMFGYQILSRGRITKDYRYYGIHQNGIELTAQGNYNNSLWTRVYKLSVINQAGIRFQPYIMAEDFDFIFRLIPLLGKCICIERIVYNYVMTPHSATQETSYEHRAKVAEDSLLCLLSCTEVFAQSDLNTTNVLKLPYNFALIGFLYSIFNKNFSWSYKQGVISKLRNANVIPIIPLPKHKRRRIFTMIMNNVFLRMAYLLYSQFFIK